MELHNFPSRRELLEWASANFIEIGQSAIAERGRFDVAFSGGSTAQEFYHTLVKDPSAREVIKRGLFFVSDERVVDQSRSESNAGNAWRLLLEPLNVKASSFFAPYDGSKPAPEAAALYEQKLKQHLIQNKEGVPIFDVIYLGLGEDGHTASLFPYSPLVCDPARSAHLVQATDEPINGFVRISFMAALILSARHLCIMAPGANKALIIKDLLNGPLDKEKWPAQLIVRSGHQALSLLQSP